MLFGTSGRAGVTHADDVWRSNAMREPVILSCAALVYMWVAMWGAQSTQSCHLPVAAARRLYLDRVMDRELVTRQVKRIREISARDATLGSSADGAACEARLTAEFARRHELPLEVVQAALDRSR